MRLEYKKIEIQDVQFGEETKVEGSTLIVNKEAVIEELMKNESVKAIDINLAKPGEKTRIIPVKDVIEPRYKEV